MEKRLYRSAHNTVIGGVCGGIAEYFDIDPIIVRLLWIFAIFSGIGFLAYIIMWIVVPKGKIDPRNIKSEYKDGYYDEEFEQTNSDRREKSKLLLGSILILVGGFSLMERYMPWFDFGFVWPIGIILLGVYLIYREKDKKNENNEDEERKEAVDKELGEDKYE